jgi:hypothetical protein
MSELVCRRQVARLRTGVGLALGVALLTLPGPAAAAASPASATARGCTWTAAVLPQVPGAQDGQVVGTDGDHRLAGMSGGHAMIWTDGRLTDLGPGKAYDVDRSGVAVGTDDGGNVFTGHATIWHGRASARLPEPAGITASVAVGIADSGVIAGIGWGSDGVQGLAWASGPAHRVRLLTLGDGGVQVNGVSAAGLIVGVYVYPSATGSVAVAGSLRSGLHALPVLVPGEDSAAQAAAGSYVVGSEGGYPVVWVNGVPHRLGDSGNPYAVNRHGLIGGIDFTTFGPVLWRGGSQIALPGPDAEPAYGSVAAITDRGEAAGQLAGFGAVSWTCR